VAVRGAQASAGDLLRRQRDGISFNEIGCRVEAAAVKRRTTNQPAHFSRIKTT